MKSLRSTALALCCALPLIASAQYQWIDKDGRKVFSDRPPPSDVPAGKILRAPRTQAVAAEPLAAATPAASTSRPAASALRLSGKDKALEEKKKQADAAAAAKKKEEEARLALMQADNCKRTRQSKAAYDSGVRMSRINEKGEREFLDDKQRTEEVARLDAIIARDCKAQ
jgi:hypothetical protein